MSRPFDVLIKGEELPQMPNILDILVRGRLVDNPEPLMGSVLAIGLAELSFRHWCVGGSW